MATVATVCSFCGLDVYIDAEMHPCCARAKEWGEARCGGCHSFARRWAKGETCPHVMGEDKACCKPPAVAA